jgi:hypothetical protein
LSAYWERFMNTEDWGAKIDIDCNMGGVIWVFWDQEGVRYEIKQYKDSDEYLKKVLDIDMLSIKEHYGEDTVKFENVAGQLPRLYIKYSSRPFNWLYTATPAQITEFAQTMSADVCKRNRWVHQPQWVAPNLSEARI